jgi:hypothetical protein
MVLTVIEHGYMIPINSNQVIEDGAVATARKLTFSDLDQIDGKSNYGRHVQFQCQRCHKHYGSEILGMR